MKIAEGILVGCPNCQTDLSFRYGNAWTGRQRYFCMLCEKLFSPDSPRKEWKDKPRCPACGKLMHVHYQGKGYLRFRCSGYPDCKQTLKK